MTRRTILLNGVCALWREPSTRWVVADATGRVRDLNWANPENSVSFGSLLKPFLAKAFLATNSQPPVIDCAGARAGCWSLKAHGRQDLTAALANSCNVYFLRIAETLNRAALDLICMSYGLVSPSRSWAAARLIGLGSGWPQTPLATVRGFCSLVRDGADTHTRMILAGMLRCCESGTARHIGLHCYAKTGTAAPSKPRDAGTGYVVAIYPVDQPRTVVLLSRGNTTGADAAKAVSPLIGCLG